MSEPGKRLWKEYNKLQNWAAQTDPEAKTFRVENFEIGNSDATPVSESNTASASSRPTAGYGSIYIIIYPSTAPFMQRGLRLEMQVPFTYPHEAPKLYMRSSIRHPNIEKNGRICSTKLDTTKKWEPTELNDILFDVIKLIDEPNLSYAVDAEFGSLYDTNRPKYNSSVEDLVKQHGIPRD